MILTKDLVLRTLFWKDVELCVSTPRQLLIKLLNLWKVSDIKISKFFRTLVLLYVFFTRKGTAQLFTMSVQCQSVFIQFVYYYSWKLIYILKIILSCTLRKHLLFFCEMQLRKITHIDGEAVFLAPVLPGPALGHILGGRLRYWSVLQSRAAGERNSCFKAEGHCGVHASVAFLPNSK